MTSTIGILAHGLGGRTDLPLNGGAAIIGGGIAVAASFFALTSLWSRPWLDPNAGRPLPSSVASVWDSSRLRTIAQGITLVLAAGVAAVALLGPADTNTNFAPWVLYITFWVGLALASALFGPVWRAVNPLRTVHRVLRPGTRRPMPAWLGYWPAAGWLAGFVWLELVVPGRSDPRLVGLLIVVYALVNLVASAIYGENWFARGDGFEVYSTLLARLSPIGRRNDGTLIMRNPLAGLVSSRLEPGLAAVACVLIGSTAFDGLTRTTYWQAVPHSGKPVTGTLGLITAITFVSVLYFVSMRVSGWLTGIPGKDLPGLFAATLLPIALGYTIAHYFSFFLLEGQTPFILISDPLGTGLDLFGTRQRTVDYRALSPALTATVQINAIVLGHIGGTAAAHDQALRLSSAQDARWGQLPVLITMVVLTCTGLLLLLSG